MGHNVGIISDPEVSHKELDKEDKFIIIGSDGIWDVMNSAEIVGLVFDKYSESNKDKIAEVVVNECRNRWDVINLYKQKLHNEKFQNKDDKAKGHSTHTPFFSVDDISTVICFFNIEESTK